MQTRCKQCHNYLDTLSGRELLRQEHVTDIVDLYHCYKSHAPRSKVLTWMWDNNDEFRSMFSTYSRDDSKEWDIAIIEGRYKDIRT